MMRFADGKRASQMSGDAPDDDFLVDDVVRIVTQKILPLFELADLARVTRCEFLASSRRIDAFVRRVAERNYAISLLRPLVSRIRDVVGEMAVAPAADTEFDYDLLRKAGFEDENGIWLSLYLYAVAFVVLHEYAHVAGGHVDYDAEIRRDDGRKGFSERRHLGAPPPLKPAAAAQLQRFGLEYMSVSRFMELEADGVAADLLFAAITEIPRTVCVDGRLAWSRLSREQRRRVRRMFFRAAQTAMLMVMAILEQAGRGSPRSGHYPFPRSRALNLLSRRLNFLERNTARNIGRDGYSHLMIDDPEEVVGVAREAIWMMSEIDRAMKTPVFNIDMKSPASDADVSAFTRDLTLHLSGRDSYQTEEGMELKSIAAIAPVIYPVLDPYRLADLWRID